MSIEELFLLIVVVAGATYIIVRLKEMWEETFHDDDTYF